MDPVELYSEASDLTIPKKYQMPLQTRDLPPGKKYHVFFSYSSSDIQWVKETVERLERERGLICCEYDRDNTPGTPILEFAGYSIRNAWKTVVVMTKEAFQSGFVLHEIEMAITQGFDERRKTVVPVLLEDCDVPYYLRTLDYVDVRDHERRDIWWPELLMNLDIQDVMDKTELVQPSGVSDLTTLEEYQMPLQRRALPPGKKYHVFFSYSSSDIQWVKETVERLEREHGLVCCEYDRDNTPGVPLLKFAADSITNAWKTVVVMTKEAFQSDFVLHEIYLAITQGFNKGRKTVVPVLLKDCSVPHHLSILDYVDVRDNERRDIWWPKLLMNLDIQEPAIPEEILKLDPRSLQLYKEALQNGTVKVYNIRVMVVGQYGVGKTTLTKRLLGQDVNISERESTNGIDVCIQFNRISPETGHWTPQSHETGKYTGLQRLVTLFMQRIQNKKSANKQGIDTVKIERPGEIEENVTIHSTGLHQENKSTILESEIKRNITFTSAQNEKSSEDVVMEILQMVNENADKFEKTMAEVATIGMWDFAGQTVYYTTHQTFLTRRAIYLLVTDLSQQVTDFVLDDQHYFDSDGIKSHTVYDLVEVWMNSIHSCALASEAGTPPVILVATHADKIPKDCRESVSTEYFSQIRDKLEDKPSVCHLADEDFVIDNTVYDPQLQALKTKIIELAKKQLYWGEEVPAKWLALEQALMKFRAAGVKVIPFSLLENLNAGGSVQIKTREELVLFLRFQHEMGMVLYFSAEGLGDKIVLEPQWLINALNSLITSKEFIRKKNPACRPVWSEFEKEGKLKPQLIDAIWTKDKNPEFHDNKEHIILLMEKLNIVARPTSYCEDGKKIKEEDYLLAPCMLKEITPEDVISPQPNSEMDSSSVLCYVFTGNFLPPPVFHRLLATCVAHWPIAKKKKENLIFCGCCVFDIDNCHRLILYHRDYVILARVTKWGITNKIPALQLCIKVKEFITQELSRIIGYLSQNLQYKLHILCPESNRNSPDIFIPLSELQKNSEVVCHSHDKSHVIVSKDLVKFWLEDLKQSEKDDTRPEDCTPACQKSARTMTSSLCQPATSTVNVEKLQSGLDNSVAAANDKVIQSPRRLFCPYDTSSGNMKAQFDETDTVWIQRWRVQLAKSIGIIKSPYGSFGTGFRVGSDCIMTAMHVIYYVLNAVPSQSASSCINHLSNAFIDFSYEVHGAPEADNLKFFFKPEIVYENADMDTAILRLQSSTQPYPPPLTLAKLPEQCGQLYFIGHSKADIKKTDKFRCIKLKSEDKTAAENWSVKHVGVNGYKGIDNPRRLLFHCTFEKGASGSPGVWIYLENLQPRAKVVTMLLCGYPDWYYDNNCPQEKKDGTPYDYCVEQGVCIRSLYEDMKVIKPDLWKEIFSENSNADEDVEMT